MAVESGIEKLLILTKTYPEPSTKYRETTCVAAVTQTGALRRIFPVPFRLLQGAQKFQKWEWIEARVAKSLRDHRPESYKIDVDTIVRDGERIGTENAWMMRRAWVSPHIVRNFAELEQRRQITGETLGFLRPSGLLKLEISPVKEKQWTDKDKASLMRDGLFDGDTIRARPPLEKLPYDFHYRYQDEAMLDLRHKITDWEAGALFRNCYRQHGDLWEIPFRQKLENDFSNTDLLFLMGTMHRIPYQRLIVGLFYPPLQPKNQQMGLTLALEGMR
jgi:hypothetical protein